MLVEEFERELQHFAGELVGLQVAELVAEGARLETMRCDILLTPHPAFAQVLEKLAAREAGKADAFIDPGACKTYAAAARKTLAARLATESAK